MNLYTSDLHFGHKNVIKFDHRPFADEDEMDNVMIELWNGSVRDDDHIYIVGDFCYRNKNTGAWYLKQLKGHKHLIIGNHDKRMLKDKNNIKYFESIDDILTVKDEYEGKSISITLFHYPIAEWNNYYSEQ